MLSILPLATRRDPRKFPASTAVPVLAFTSSYLKIPNMYVNGKGVEIGQLFSLEMVLNIHEKLFTFPKTTYQIAKSEKIWNILCLQASKWVTGNSFVVCGMSSGKIVVQF